MTEVSSLSIIGTAMAAWRKSLGAFSDMVLLFFCTMVALIPVNILSTELLDELIANPGAPILLLAELGICALQAVAVTPLAIAVHRYVLLGEVFQNDSQLIDNSRYVQFAAYAFGYNVIIEIPLILAFFSNSDEILFTLLLLALVLALLILVIKIGLRTIILFPAIAVDAAGANWLNAMRDTTGHTWRVLLILGCVSAPLLSLVEAILVWSTEPSVDRVVKTTLTILESGVITFWIACLAAAASYIFLAYTNRLGRPPNLKPATL